MIAGQYLSLTPRVCHGSVLFCSQVRPDLSNEYRGELILQLAAPSRKGSSLTVKAALLFMSLAAMMSCRKSGPPYSPEESLSKLQVADGFRVELAATEPQVLD